MADELNAPASPDPFEQIFAPKAPGPSPQDADNPFSSIMPKPVAPPTSATGAFARGAERGLLPALGSLPAVGAGAEFGAFLGGFGGPAAPVTVPIGTLAGGVTGGLLGATAIAKVQEWALSKLPDSWREAIGQDDRQQRLDEVQHPNAAFLGGLAPYALTMRPGGLSKTALPENATALQRIMAHPATARLFGGGLMGGVELGQEYAHGDVDWSKVAISTGFGVVFNKPMRPGVALTEMGARPVRNALGVIHPEPTVAEAADAKVMGPGITEQVFNGSHEQDSSAAMTAHEMARAEQAAVPSPDVHAVARRMHPELFGEYDALLERRDTFRHWIEEAREGGEPPPAAAAHLAATEAELARLSPEVSAAYRRAAEAAGTPIHEPMSAAKAQAVLLAPGAPQAGQHPAPQAGQHPAPPPLPAGPEPAAIPRPIEEQRSFIADDVARQMIKAGRPEAEARSAGALIAARYEARAARLGGAAGSAEDLYHREGAEIIGEGQRSRQGAEQPRAPRRVDEGKLSLFQFLAHRGGLAPHGDIAYLLDGNPFIPGFGRLIRQGGMSLDRAREAAVEAGYLHDEAQHHGGVSESTVNHLLDAIGEEAHGRKLYRAGYEPPRAEHGEELPEGLEPHEVDYGETAAQDEHYDALAREREDAEFFQGQYAPPFYSALARTIEGAKQEKASPEQWLGMLKNAQGVKAEEMEWLGLADWLKQQKGSVTKQQIADYVRANNVELREVRKGADFDEDAVTDRANRLAGEFAREHNIDLGTDHGNRLYSEAYRRIHSELMSRESVSGPVKFGQYQLPGGENYRELLLTLPEKDTITREPSTSPQGWGTTEGGAQGFVERGNTGADYRSSHWDEPNVLAHIRFNDRTIDGKKTLFIEEIQSDWHQQGRRRGYREQISEAERPAAIEKLHDLEAQLNAMYSRRDTAEYAALRVEEQTLRSRIVGTEGVPRAPFKTSWPELSLKRMIRYAAEHGYDQIAWTPGKVQAERYDLSKQIDKIATSRESDGRYRVEVYAKYNSHPTVIEEKTASELADFVGKELADKVIAHHEPSEERYFGRKIWSDVDLRVGGEGMATFYDKMLPAAANKLVKKYGAKVGEGELEGAGEIDHDLRLSGEDEDVYQGSVSVHTLPLPEALRDAAVSQGMPLFQGAQGKIRFTEGRRPVITLMRSANASTFIHESGHDFLEQLFRDATHEAAPADLKGDASTVRRWLGVGETEDIKTRHHEKFARGFEQYLREGVAPSPGLAGAFARFRDWLLQIYRTVQSLGEPISEDIRKVFDRMLAAEPQRTVIAPERAMGPTLPEIHGVEAAHAEPEEAAATLARLEHESERAAVEPPREIADEIAQAEQARAAAKELAGEAGERPGAEAEMGGDRGGPEPQPAGGGVGAGHGPVVDSSGNAGGEGHTVRGDAAGSADDLSGPQPQPLAPRPSPLFGPRESPFLDKAGNIRLENLTSAEDVRQAYREAAERNNDFIGDRRGVVTDGQVMDLAHEIGMTGAEDLVKRWVVGQALNAEQVMAVRLLSRQTSVAVHDAYVRADKSGAPEDFVALVAAQARHDLVQATLSGATAEAGRAMRALRKIKDESGVLSSDEIIQQASGRTLFQKMAEARLGSKLDTPQKVAKFQRDAQKRSFGRMILEYFVNNLISGPATHITYTVGNAVLLAEKLALITPTAAMIGRLARGAGREGNVVHMDELAAGLRGLRTGLPAAIKAVGQSIKTGVNVELPGEGGTQGLLPFQPTSELAPHATVDLKTGYADLVHDLYGVVQGLRDGFHAAASAVAAGGVEGSPLVGLRNSTQGVIPDIEVRGMNVLPIGTVMRLPSRMVAAIHSLFRVLNYSVDINQQAARAAGNEGLTGNARAARIAELRQNPTAEMMESSRTAATELTLMGQGGEFMRKLSGLTNWEVDLPVFGLTQPLKFIDPFVKIAGNVMKQSVGTQSPAGLLLGEVRADLSGANGTVAQDLAAAKMLVGTALGVTFGTLAAQGLMSGSGPTDRHKAAMWRLAGNQAHSVRIGDMWYDVHKIGPVGLLASTAADIYDIAHAMSEDDASEVGAKFLHAVTHNFLDESFMRGPSDLLKAIEDSDRYGESYVRNFLSSFLPYSVGSAQVARAVDPYSRQVRSIMDGFKAKIPGLSETLLPRRDVWGEPMVNHDALVAKGITAIYMTQMSHDPVNLALLDLDINVAPLPRKIRNVDLTDDQYDDFARIGGRMTKMRLDAIVKSPDYQSWPNHIRRDVITEVVRQSREAARGMMFMKYPQLVRDAVEEIKRKRLED